MRKSDIQSWRKRHGKIEKATWKDGEREREIERWKKWHGKIEKERERDRKMEKATWNDRDRERWKVGEEDESSTSKSGKFSSENVWEAFFVFEVNNKQQVDK